MSAIVPALKLTHVGALAALNQALACAEANRLAVTVSIVDASGVLLAACRMDGAYFLSVESSLNKATTAASVGRPTGRLDDATAIKLGVATFGRQTLGLRGGVPIIVDGMVLGGIGTGSATGEEDEMISLSGLSAIPGATTAFD
jgi:glc operon protein GlcG